MGLFEVNMPLLYGEGGRSAFHRLQEEMMKSSPDQSIFAWGLPLEFFHQDEAPRTVISSSLAGRSCLADSPADSPADFFYASRVQMQRTERDEDAQHYTMTNLGVNMSIRPIPLPSGEWLLPLRCTLPAAELSTRRR